MKNLRRKYRSVAEHKRKKNKVWGAQQIEGNRMRIQKERYWSKFQHKERIDNW